jgi:hypothetical protein
MANVTLYSYHYACDIYYNADFHAVHTIWKNEYLSGPPFRAIMNNIIELLKEKHISLIIADATEMRVISEDDQQWLMHDWYHRAVDAGFNFEVLILKQDTFSELAIKKIVHHYDDQLVRTVYCNSYEEAAKWLTENKDLVHYSDNSHGS